MKKDVKSILKLAKKIVAKDVYKKLKKVKDEEELREAAKYSLISALKKEEHEINNQIKKFEEESKDVFFAKNKALLIPSKIKHLQVEFDKKEFEKLMELLKEAKKEVANLL
jgi:hypothetical protein